MPRPESLPCRTARQRGRPGAALQASALTLFAVAAAGWLAAPSGIAQQGGNRLPRHASPALEQATWYMMALPRRTNTVALAAQGTHEGHWRFVNRAGEMFTVGTPDEMKRVISVLHPQAKTGVAVSLYLTEDTVYRHRATLKSLPSRAELNMVAGEGSYRLLRRGGAAGERVLAEVRANLAVEIGEKRLFEEALWHLARPLRTARVRVLALQPGGPRALPASPPADPAGKGALVDVIDPANLPAAMGSVSGQVLLVVGRVERGLLHVRPARGPEHILPLQDLFKAAAEADVNLVVLRAASTPRQPQGRNRLWSPGGSLRRAQVADLVSGLAGSRRRMAVAVSAAGRRTVLEVTMDGALSLPDRPAGGRLSRTVADIAGRAGMTGMTANLLGAARQREIDWRLLPGIPAAVQAGYLALIVLGLVGMPLARAWWARIWPPEAASEYGGRSGYWAACAVRGLVFVLVFVPVTAVATGPWNLGTQIVDTVRRPGRGWRWVKARAGDGDGGAPAPEPGRKSRRKARV